MTLFASTADGSTGSMETRDKSYNLQRHWSAGASLRWDDTAESVSYPGRRVRSLFQSTHFAVNIRDRMIRHIFAKIGFYAMDLFDCD